MSKALLTTAHLTSHEILLLPKYKNTKIYSKLQLNKKTTLLILQILLNR